MVPLVLYAACRGWWAPDEPRYAEVARELHANGNFLVLRLCGEVYPDKPPLLYWLAALLGWLSGWNEFAMRLVSLVASALSAMLVARLADRWWGPAEARLAPALFLGTAMLGEIGGRLQIDPLLCSLCLWAIFELDRFHSQADVSRGAYLRAGLALGLAGLAKGPVAWLIVGLVVLSWRLLAQPLTRPARLWRLRLSLALLAVTPVVAWALLAATSEPLLWDQLFFRQHLGRAMEGKQHAGPFWKHLWRMPLFLLPWTLPVVLGLVHASRQWRLRRLPESDQGLLRAALWFGVLFLFFSAIPTKRDLYLLPAYPAAALVAARWIMHCVRRECFPTWVSQTGAAIFTVVGSLILLLSGLVWMFLDRLPDGIVAREVAWRAVLCGGATLGLSCWSWCCLRQRDGLLWVRAQLSTWSVGLSLCFMLFVPMIDPLKSARTLGLWLAQRPERPQSIPCLGIQPEGFRFYGGVPTVRGDDLEQALARDRADFLALARKEHYQALSQPLSAQIQVLHQARVGSRDILVLGARVARQTHSEASTAER